MNLVESATNVRTLLVAIGIFGLAPGIVLRLIVRSYPKGHPRREELVAELYAIPMGVRPFWVAQQLETAVFEGLPTRWRAWRAQRRVAPAVKRLLFRHLVPLASHIFARNLFGYHEQVLAEVEGDMLKLVGSASPMASSAKEILIDIHVFRSMRGRSRQQRQFVSIKKALRLLSNAS